MSEGELVFTSMDAKRARDDAARQEYAARQERVRRTGVSEPGESAKILAERALAGQRSTFVPETPPILPSLQALIDRAMPRRPEPAPTDTGEV